MLTKRLARMAFMQGPGSNYRKLTVEEKLEAEKNFYESLKSLKGELPKTRNYMSYFKELISNASIPKAKQISYEYTIHNDKYYDNYH